MLPHEGVSSGTPRPRNDRYASKRMFAGDQQRGVDDDRREQVGQDLAEHDPQVPGPERPARLDELALAQRQRVAADEPRDVGPGEERDDHDHQAQPRLERPVEAALLRGRARRDDADGEQQQRHREDDVGRPRDEACRPSRRSSRPARRGSRRRTRRSRSRRRRRSARRGSRRSCGRRRRGRLLSAPNQKSAWGPSGMPKMSVVSRWKSSFGPWPVRAAKAGARIATRTSSPMNASPASANRSCLKRVQNSCQGVRPTIWASAASGAGAPGAPAVSAAVVVTLRGAVTVGSRRSVRSRGMRDPIPPCVELHECATSGLTVVILLEFPAFRGVLAGGRSAPRAAPTRGPEDHDGSARRRRSGRPTAPRPGACR